jgi:AraC-like DNA-binding protein
MITNFKPAEIASPSPPMENGFAAAQPDIKQTPDQLWVFLSEIGAFFLNDSAPDAQKRQVFASENVSLLLNGAASVTIPNLCAQISHYSAQVQQCQSDVNLSIRTLGGLKFLSLRLQEGDFDAMAEGKIFRLNGLDKCLWYQLVSAKPCPPELRQLLEAVLAYRGQVWLADQPKFIEVLLPLCTIGATASYEPSAFIKSLLYSIDLQFTNGHFGIDQLAASLNISRAQLFRKVKAELQIAPHDFLFEMRMEAAWVLVTRTDLNIGKLFNMIGFASDSYFHQAFKRYYGVQPNAIRKVILDQV